MKLISWNVNGLRAVEKKGFLDWLRRSRADVVAVQETKARPEQLSPALLRPPGYQAEWNWAEKKGYSGVATYSKIAPYTVARGLSDPRFDSEGRVLIAEYDSFVFFNVYFPSGQQGRERVEFKLAVYRRFLEVARDYMNAGRAIVATGDFNTAYAKIDLARPQTNARTSGFLPEERTALGEFFAAGLVDTFRYLHPKMAKYTWWDVPSGARARDVGWRLDAFLVSRDLIERVVKAEIHSEVFGSDHCPVSLVLAES